VGQVPAVGQLAVGQLAVGQLAVGQLGQLAAAGEASLAEPVAEAEFATTRTSCR
jgi:hypothetical protein